MDVGGGRFSQDLPGLQSFVIRHFSKTYCNGHAGILGSVRGQSYGNHQVKGHLPSMTRSPKIQKQNNVSKSTLMSWSLVAAFGSLLVQKGLSMQPCTDSENSIMLSEHRIWYNLGKAFRANLNRPRECLEASRKGSSQRCC